MQKLLSLILILLIACSSEKKEYAKQPQELLSQPQMVAILTDMQASEGVMAIKLGGNLNKITAQKNSYQAAILKKHAVEATVFWENYQYYSENPQILDTIYAQVIKELEKQLPAEKERMAKNPPIVAPVPSPTLPPKPKILPPISAGKGIKQP